MKFILKSVCLLIIGACVVLALEVACFYGILVSDKPLSSADVVVVFHGTPDRVKEGYRLVNERAASLLVISPSNEVTRNRYNTMYGQSGHWRHLLETRAETTFQNALMTARLVREQQLKSVVLVTDACHTPRSYLLLRMMLLGSKVTILPAQTPNTSYPKSPLKWCSRQWKQLYNELVEFWGSVAELAIYKAQGELPERGLKERAWVKALRRALLVEI
jgi:uncharacterized SAM-binding protein YcdF (DUF218 family)